eukprot:scaffold70349_cov28-Prasinocladus_malaysianus.AAC.2
MRLKACENDGAQQRLPNFSNATTNKGRNIDQTIRTTECMCPSSHDHGGIADFCMRGNQPCIYIDIKSK